MKLTSETNCWSVVSRMSVADHASVFVLSIWRIINYLPDQASTLANMLLERNGMKNGPGLAAAYTVPVFVAVPVSFAV